MSQVRLAALRLLGRRDYSTAELRERLVKKHFGAEDIAETLAALTDERLLDDRRVAASHVRVAASVKGRGRLRIARELEARGIERGLIHDALAALPAEDETAAIRAFLARKRVPDRITAAEHRRLFNQLLRRGFSADAIAKVFRTRRDED